jgi:hypothetical protein
MKITAAILITAIVIISCTKNVEVKIPYDGDKLVLNSLFTADSNLYAKLYVSKKVTASNNFVSPATAVLTLFENNINIGNFSVIDIYGVKYYKSPITAKAGRSYKITAASPNYTTVEATDTVPFATQVQIQSLGVITATNNNTSGFDRKLKFRLKDDAFNENFYMVKVFLADTNRTAAGPRYTFPNGTSYGFQCEVEGFNTDPLNTISNFGDNEVFISDETFNGKDITLTLNFAHYGGNFSHFALEVTSISKTTYRYLKSVKLQQNTTGDPLAEVSLVYNNVINGYGIVGAANKKLVFVKKI